MHTQSHFIWFLALPVKRLIRQHIACDSRWMTVNLWFNSFKNVSVMHRDNRNVIIKGFCALKCCTVTGYDPGRPCFEVQSINRLGTLTLHCQSKCMASSRPTIGIAAAYRYLWSLRWYHNYRQTSSSQFHAVRSLWLTYPTAFTLSKASPIPSF